MPLTTGCSGDSARSWCAATASGSSRARRVSLSIAAIFWISCEVRNPSKKCRNGTLDSAVAACAMAARSWASCGEPEASIAKPLWRTAITSEWSPKIESACVATLRAATCMQNAVSSPAILYMLGSINSRPCDAVNVVVSAPVCSAPCTAPAAPPSDCISTTSGTVPQRFSCRDADHSSACSPMGDAGVIG